MESSTYNAACLSPEDYTRYYTVFYDSLSDIASRFGGRVIKYVGDALIIYFPATSDPSNRDSFESILDCATAMLDIRSTINDMFRQENLPSISYRISADYGRMACVENEKSKVPDWIGPSMNMVAKMNRTAQANTLVIGGDLHQVLSRLSLQEYGFEHAGELNIGIRQKYPVYSVSRKRSPGVVSGDSVKTIACTTPNNRLNSNSKGGPGAGGLANVLIVDDEQDILLTYKQFLSGQPVNVEAFSDPLQLLGRLALVGPTYYDLAIIDIKMPKMNGFQVYQILAALKPAIKAIFVSGLDYAEEILSILRWIDKEEDILKKPVTKEKLVCAVNNKIKLLA